MLLKNIALIFNGQTFENPWSNNGYYLRMPIEKRGLVQLSFIYNLI